MRILVPLFAIALVAPSAYAQTTTPPAIPAPANVAAAPVITKSTGVLGAADVYTADTTFWVMESLRLDLGVASQVHP